MKYKLKYYPKTVLIKFLKSVGRLSQEEYDSRKNKYRMRYRSYVLDEFTDTPPLKKGFSQDKECYLKYLLDSNYNRKDHFIPISEDSFKPESGDVKIIAWYLPQFHQMEVNNKYHGQGFTEWTNVTQAIPAFVGHYQPHIPYDVGFYDLLNIETFKRQIFLAKKYGVHGFCFHWYWFSGQRTMEKPLKMLLDHPELDIPFCINWANENWSCLWDGGNKELIFEQTLNDCDDKKFMEDILPYLKDSRYLKIDGKPVLSIYRTKGMFDKDRCRKLFGNFKRIAKENGLQDLYILITNSFDNDEDPEEWGADALLEYAPFVVGRMARRFKNEMQQGGSCVDSSLTSLQAMFGSRPLET